MANEIIEKYKEVLGNNDFLFLKRIYSSESILYENRLKAIGFENMNSILDAGCGFGQWSLALANLNEKVYSTDLSPIRLVIGKEMATHQKKKNIKFMYASIEKQPFEDEHFDGVFCYGAIFLGDPVATLKEFYRILKPGGKIYVNANGIGWSLNLWINAPNSTVDYDPKYNVAKAFTNTANYERGLPKGEGQLIIEKEELTEMINNAGFSNIICQDEGTINVNHHPLLKITPFFKGEYYGHTGVYEIIADKAKE